MKASFSRSEPPLVSIRQRSPGPEDPVSEAGEVSLGGEDRLFDLLSAGRSECAPAGEVVPPALPAVPDSGLTQRTLGAQFDVKLNAGLVGTGGEFAVPAVVATDESPAEHLEVGFRAPGQFRELIPVDWWHGLVATWLYPPRAVSAS